MNDPAANLNVNTAANSNATAVPVSIKVKLNKPEPSKSERGFLLVNNGLKQVEHFFNLVQLSNGQAVLGYGNKLNYACTLLNDTAAIWWFRMLQSDNHPTTRADLVTAIRKDFVPEDDERRAGKTLRRLKQKPTVTSYLSEFRKIIPTISDMSESDEGD